MNNTLKNKHTTQHKGLVWPGSDCMNEGLQKSTRIWIQLVQSIKSNRTTPIDKILIEQEDFCHTWRPLAQVCQERGSPGRRAGRLGGNVELHQICHSHVIRITPAGKKSHWPLMLGNTFSKSAFLLAHRGIEQRVQSIPKKGNSTAILKVEHNLPVR